MNKRRNQKKKKRNGKEVKQKRIKTKKYEQKESKRKRIEEESRINGKQKEKKNEAKRKIGKKNKRKSKRAITRRADLLHQRHSESSGVTSPDALLTPSLPRIKSSKTSLNISSKQTVSCKQSSVFFALFLFVYCFLAVSTEGRL